MKKSYTFVLSILLVFTFSSQAQHSTKKGAIGITFSGIGQNDAHYSQDLEGAGGYNGKGYYSFGINYIRPITPFFDLETGVEYGRYNYEFSNPSLGPDMLKLDNIKLSLVQIPVTVRFNFLRYFFLNGGVLLDIDASEKNQMESQSGIGAILGLGVKYDLKNAPVGFFVNPYFKQHNLLPFSSEKYHVRAKEYGFRLGVVYHL